MIRKIILVSAGVALSIATACAHADPNCAEAAQMKLTVKEYHLDLNDNRPVCIAVPGVFKIKISNPPGSGIVIGGGEVTVVQKADPDDASVLISGVNGSPVNKLTVNIELAPGKSIEFGDEFEFWIHVQGVGTLDPRIKVVDNETMNSLQYAAVDDAMDTWNENVEDINKLRPPAE